MRTYLDCIPCFMTQALKVGKLSSKNDAVVKRLLDETGLLIGKIDLDATPPEIGAEIYAKAKEVTGINDPFKDFKKNHIKEALALYEKMKTKINESQDPLLTSIRVAIAGNVIDLGVNKKFNLEKDIETILLQEFSIFDYDKFKEKLNKAKSVLYIGDNAGESVFDKLLIEQLNKPVTYAVRGVPIINDCTYDDAVLSGLDDVAEIISSGSSAPATILKLCNKNFIEIFNTADLIISKGQGNFEGLSEVDRPICFMLKAKCHVIASHLGVKEEGIVLKFTS